MMRKIRGFFGWNRDDRMRSSSDVINSSWMLAEKFVRLVIGVFVGAYVARFLGPDSFGVLAYTQSIVAILLSVAAFGLNAIVVRSLVNATEPAAAVIGGALAINILGCAIAGVGYFAVLTFAGFTDLEAKVFTIIGLVVFFSIHSPVEAVLQARLQYRVAGGAIILASLVTAALRIVLVQLDAPLIAFAYAYLVEQGLIVVALFACFLFTEGWQLGLKTNWAGTRRMLASAFPTLLSSMVVIIYMRADQIMIRQLMDVDAVGIYSAAVRISEAWYFIPTMLTLSLFPSILNARHESEAAFLQRMRALFDIVVIVSWAAILAAVLLGRVAILALYGVAFAEAAIVLQIHIVGGLFVAVGVASSRWYLSSGWERRLLYRAVLGLLVNIGLNFLLIPSFGLTGAAWATVGGYAFGYWMFDLLHPETRPVFRSKTWSMFMAPVSLLALRSRNG
jgi:O-antigen/teichoic acid export membrane protein